MTVQRRKRIITHWSDGFDAATALSPSPRDQATLSQSRHSLCTSLRRSLEYLQSGLCSWVEVLRIDRLVPERKKADARLYQWTATRAISIA